MSELAQTQGKLVQQLPPPVDAPAGLNGIGGWLILVAIGQHCSRCVSRKRFWEVAAAAMNASSWRSLTDPIESSYNAWWAPSLLFELFLNIGAFVFAVLLVALFSTKKAAWRRAFALFLISFFVGADTVLVDRIPSAAEPIFTSVAILAPICPAAASWIPYVSFSKTREGHVSILKHKSGNRSVASKECSDFSARSC